MLFKSAYPLIDLVFISLSTAQKIYTENLMNRLNNFFQIVKKKLHILNDSKKCD